MADTLNERIERIVDAVNARKADDTFGDDEQPWYIPDAVVEAFCAVAKAAEAFATLPGPLSNALAALYDTLGGE